MFLGTFANVMGVLKYNFVALRNATTIYILTYKTIDISNEFEYCRLIYLITTSEEYLFLYTEEFRLRDRILNTYFSSSVYM